MKKRVPGIAGRALVGLALAGWVPHVVSGDTITVCADGGAEFVTIQEAVDAAVADDEVVVCDGTYVGPGNKNVDFRGKNITVRSENGLGGCIIDCEGDGRGFDFLSGEGPLAVLEGFVITNANLVGAIRIQSSSPTIRNCEITANLDLAVYSFSASPEISDCVITDNAGDGIFANAGGSLLISDCTISNNTGTGVNINAADATIERCEIAANGWGVSFSSSSGELTECAVSGSRRSGLLFNASSPTVKACTIDANRGGGVICAGGAPQFVGCTITGNTADRGGGIDLHSSSDAAFINCTIADNTATSLTLGNGGGVFCDSGSPLLMNCVLTGNLAVNDGGGLYFAGACQPRVVNCTFHDNLAVLFGGAVAHAGSSVVQMRNSILWNDSAALGHEISLIGADPSCGELRVAHCDVQGGEMETYADADCRLVWGLGNLASDPNFVSVTAGNFRLAAGSPCIDAGDNTVVPADAWDLDADGDTLEPVPLDFGGAPRFIDDPATSDTGIGTPPIVDIGAFEFVETLSHHNSDPWVGIPPENVSRIVRP